MATEAGLMSNWQVWMYIFGFAMMGAYYIYKQLSDLAQSKRTIEVYEIDGKNVQLTKARYYPDDGIAVRNMKTGPWKSIAVKYVINEQHMLYKIKTFFGGLIKTLQPMILVDIRTRRSISPQSGKPEGSVVNQLDYLTERNFWLALMTRIKVPISVWVIGMFMGAGVYSILRLILASLGLHVP